MPTIALLPGDGIGPEVAAAAVKVLNAVSPDLDYDEHLAGGAAIDAHGTALTDEALAACKASDAVLLVVRELTGGLYYGDRGTSDGRAFDTMVYTVAEIERITRTAFQAAKSR